MKKGLIILFVFLITITLYGCGNDVVQEDLLNYINEELPKIVDLESTVIEGYDNVSGNNYTNDEVMYLSIRDEILPASLRLIEAAEDITPETKEVKDIHEIYISAINTQNSAFTTILSALETQDYEKISIANEKLDDSRKKMRDYTSSITELAKEHNVEFLE